MTELSDALIMNGLEFDGQELRGLHSASLQEGAIAAGDLLVSPGSTGVSVDVAAGSCYVKGDSITEQGLYRCRNDATVNSADFELGGFTAADPTDPRLDMVVARAYDNAHDALGLKKWRLEIIDGTPTAGATLDNRSGATTLPDSAMLLADALVAAGESGPLVAGDLRDRRKWGRGAYMTLQDLAGDHATASTSFVALNATVEKRIECSGVPIRVSLHGVWEGTLLNQILTLALYMDGAAFEANRNRIINVAQDGSDSLLAAVWEFVPAAGSHVFRPYFKTNSGTITIFASSNRSLQYSIEEIVRQNTSND